jgi:hypothetical protein
MGARGVVLAFRAPSNSLSIGFNRRLKPGSPGSPSPLLIGPMIPLVKPAPLSAWTLPRLMETYPAGFRMTESSQCQHNQIPN